MSDTLPSKKHNWIAVAATLLVLAALCLFTWRVVYYAQLIRSGDISGSDLSFLSSYTVNTALASTPLPDGQFDVRSADDPSLGSADATVQIVEFADFGCPYSRESSFVMRALAAAYGDKIHYEYRDFPITELHPQAEHAAEAAQCAAAQGKFWEYHDKLYVNQTDLRDEQLVQYAEELNLDTDAFAKCLSSGQFHDEVTADYNDGAAAGVRGTPTFFVNGNRIPGSIPQDVLTQLIDRALVSAP